MWRKMSGTGFLEACKRDRARVKEARGDGQIDELDRTRLSDLSMRSDV